MISIGCGNYGGGGPYLQHILLVIDLNHGGADDSVIEGEDRLVDMIPIPTDSAGLR